MKNIDEVFATPGRSAFRQRFHLHPRGCAYLDEKGLTAVMEHAGDFITQRLAPANPRNDGKQPPFQGHPAFMARHAAATCCQHLHRETALPADMHWTSANGTLSLPLWVVGPIQRFLSETVLPDNSPAERMK